MWEKESDRKRESDKTGRKEGGGRKPKRMKTMCDINCDGHENKKCKQPEEETNKQSDNTPPMYGLKHGALK